MSFLPKLPLLFMISLACGSDLVLLQHLLPSLPSPKHSQSEQKNPDKLFTQFLSCSLEMLQRGSPYRERWLWACRGILTYVTQFILFPWCVLRTHKVN